MDFRLLSKLLGILSLLLGIFMLLSLFWSNPNYSFHTDRSIDNQQFESAGFQGLLSSSVIACLLGGMLYYFGKGSRVRIYRKEAMAVVGLSWLLATFLGALPFVLSGTQRGPSIKTYPGAENRLMIVSARWQVWHVWEVGPDLSDEQFEILHAVAQQSARGLSERELTTKSGNGDAAEIFRSLREVESLAELIILPGEEVDVPADRASHFRLRWVKMGLIDSMFESQSGFSTTGATVLCDLEDPYLVPRCILFWRASTHFLGGLGIIVLFVVLLGQGSAGKALMRAEMPGPTQDNSTARMQHNAWRFAALYVGLNFILAVILFGLGMSAFDAVCHAFATMATGGFSTYNGSLGHFANGLPETSGIAIEYVVILFMLVAGTNFTLLYLALIGQWMGVLRDIEFRTYLAVVISVSLIIAGLGLLFGDPGFETTEKGIRASLFQTVSVITTTGYGTSDFDQWNQISRASLLLCMFVGGCAGSTGGGMKVIRHVLFVKILGLEVERAFRPKVVQLLKLNGTPVEDQDLRHSILVYFAFVVLFFVVAWLFVVLVEPDSTWGAEPGHKLLDSASAVISTLNNIGPGLGVCGPTSNYADFCGLSKSLFILLMMLGRLEIFPVIVLFAPGFWRDQ